MRFRRLGLMAGFALALAPIASAPAGVGDLLVAPTRIILDGRGGAEIILNNIGEDVATYRVSLELKRMKADGTLESVVQANDKEKAAESMILYAPRKVTLPPNQPQSIRVTARVPQGLPDGEYRVHMLFRAIPDPKPVTEARKPGEVAFRLIPIYGVTIPVIVRLGQLQATAGIGSVEKIVDEGKPALKLALTRNGTRSVYGEIKVTRPGVDEPIAVANGVAIYSELPARSIVIPIDPKYAAQATGPVKVSYVEKTPTGPVILAETSAVLR